MRLKLLLWLTVFSFALSGALYARQPARAAGQEDILRLHVIANSDSPEDQAAKLKVRDTVLNYEAARLDAKSAGTVRAGILEDGANLLYTVEESLEESGMGYGAKLALGRYAFPEREYAGCVYPAGEYAALRVVLGKGAGQNWWCVLFPPLCILELPDGEIEDEEMQSLILKLWKEGKNKDDSDG